MATEQKKINSYDTVSSVGANDYLLLLDASGSCKKMNINQLPPPIEWRRFILDDIKIAYISGGSLKVCNLDQASEHLNDYLGIYLPEYGRVVFPRVINLQWGSKFATATAADESTFYTQLTSGLAATRAAYNAYYQDNMQDTYAVGYAQNASRSIGGYGYGARRWYIPHPSEWMMILYPNYYKIKYAANLLGYSWGVWFWTAVDGSAGNAYRFSVEQGNIITTGKEAVIGAVLMAEFSTKLDQVS